MSTSDDQQFCLRWNNFQANITSQFEALRDDEDFTDVTIACDGQRIQAHKVVLSACSPFFKELFKTNPCSHPIVFMKDVEARDIGALMEFMYAGEVNVAQAHLSAFLKTAESLKIRGLTDTSADHEGTREEETLLLNPQPTKSPPNNSNSASSTTTTTTTTNKHKSSKQVTTSSSSTVAITPSQDLVNSCSNISSPPPKRPCKTDSNITNNLEIGGNRLKQQPQQQQQINSRDDNIVNTFAIQNECRATIEPATPKPILQPKLELPDYLSDDDGKDEALANFYATGDVTELPGGMEIIPQIASFAVKEGAHELVLPSADTRKLHSLDPRPCEECGRVYSNLSNLRQHMKLIHYPTYVQCPVCKKPFKTDLYLRRHLLTSHEGYSSNSSINNNTNSRGGYHKIYHSRSNLNSSGPGPGGHHHGGHGHGHGHHSHSHNTTGLKVTERLCNSIDLKYELKSAS